MKKVILFTFITMFTGCAVTKTVEVPVSNIIPPRMQQQINTAASKSVSFNFKGTPKAERVVVHFKRLKNAYSIDKPFKQLFRELMRTKFQDIKPESSNKINVEISSFKTTNNNSEYSLRMTITVQLADGKRKDERKFTYGTSAGYKFSIGHARFIQIKPANQLLLKFVIATDKYIDSFYGIQ
jgi:uncharacterized lipoprotein YajG